MKWVIYAAVFGGGVFVGVQLTKYIAQKKIESGGHEVIDKVLGKDTYWGQVATQVFDVGVDRAVNN